MTAAHSWERPRYGFELGAAAPAAPYAAGGDLPPLNPDDGEMGPEEAQMKFVDMLLDLKCKESSARELYAYFAILRHAVGWVGRPRILQRLLGTP